MEVIAIIAILVAPLLAVQVQRWLDALRQRYQRREQIFKTLMSTRAGESRLAQAHVEALNMIDIEFRPKWFDLRTKQKFQAVLDAWKEYLDHLNTPAKEYGTEQWAPRSDTLFIALLHTMALALGYSFDKVLLKKGLYFPQAHGQQSLLTRHAQLRVWEMLDGRRPFPICILKPPETPKQAVCEENHKTNEKGPDNVALKEQSG
jgi:hypothetical protein